ncbi:MAG TPA: LiaF domain-containing protein [Ktedonobacterales bacterium]
MQQPPALTPQQEGIREARTRYEQGILTFDQFEYALNALLQAQTPEECQAIIQELPSSLPSNALDVAATPLPSVSAAPRVPRSRWMVAILGGVQRMRRPWKLAEQTHMLMLCGGAELDLNLAALPQNGFIRIIAVMGGAKLYVPRSVDVAVHGLVLCGGISALGEQSGGIISFANEESQGVAGPAGVESRLTIQVFTLMGGVEVVQVDAPILAGGMPLALADPGQMVTYNRHAAHELRHAERRAWKEQRRQHRYD